MEKNNEIYIRINEKVKENLKDSEEKIKEYKRYIDYINKNLNPKGTRDRLIALRREFKINKIEISIITLSEILEVRSDFVSSLLKSLNFEFRTKSQEISRRINERKKLLGAEIKPYSKYMTLKELTKKTGFSMTQIIEACDYCFLDTKHTKLYDKNPFTEHELKFVKGNARRLYAEEVAEYLEREVKSVLYHAEKNGIKINRRPLGDLTATSRLINKPIELDIGSKYLMTLDEGHSIKKEIYEVLGDYDQFYLLGRKTDSGDLIKTTIYKYERGANISRMPVNTF